MAEIKWIKLSIDMFDNRKIRHIRKLPEGDNIVLIWVILLTLAGRCNASGMIFLTENIPYTNKMLADELGFEESVIALSLQVLEQFGMICRESNVLMVSGWEDHQNIDGMDRVREQARLRKQKQRERKNELLCDSPRDSHVTVTPSHATDIDIELDKDIDINNIVEQSPTPPRKKATKPEYPYKEIVDYLNEKAGKNFLATSKDTRNHIRARFTAGYGLDDFKKVIDIKVSKWKGTEFEDYLRPGTLFSNKFEGYLNESPSRAAPRAKQTGFNNIERQSTDYKAAVKQQQMEWLEQMKKGGGDSGTA